MSERRDLPSIGLTTRWMIFPDGQLYVDLHGYGIEPPLSPAEALACLLRSLGTDRPEELASVG